MSHCPSKRANTSSYGVTFSRRRGGRRAQPPAPLEEEIEHINPDVDVIPGCKYGIRVVPAHARNWYKAFVPGVSPDPEVGLDDGKLARKYSGIYNNIRYLGFESLFRPGESVNVNLVKEFYANRQYEASLDAVYDVQVGGKMIPLSSQVINKIMGFMEHSHKLFQRLLCQPNYPDIRRQLCGADSFATWMRDDNEVHKDMKKSNSQRPTRVLI
ncbi:hypothetical protein A4A49_21590 [Nicotiana attenuata]|uniref:Uncharacterized protein n=1 Tax=Nicotiana attenuata TaxID=49451 RepID=A0A1J6IU68_NICAT|nr:hypothetical protein A4A49_21590 [Nicotiana attenuata]